MENQMLRGAGVQEDDRMTRFISELAAGIDPYVPGEQPKDRKYVKLNTNENPYPPSVNVTEAIKGAVDDLRLYPDPEVLALRKAIAEYYGNRMPELGGEGIGPEHVFVGNGSDEVLALIMPAFFSGRTIGYADVTYSFYPVIAGLFGVQVRHIPLRDDFSISPEDYAGSNVEGLAGLVICNPNAPTGMALSLADIEQILSANRDRLVVVDEAYVDFGTETAVGLINKYDNVLVVQTMSKSRQLAGMRIGFAIGNPELIEAVNRVKNSFNSYPADRLAIAAGIAAMEDTEYFDETCGKIADTRDRYSKELEGLGFHILPSKSNFLFAEPPALGIKDGTDAAYVFKKLREKGVLVRYFAKPRIDNRLRITIGTDEEMDVLLASIKEIIAEAER